MKAKVKATGEIIELDETGVSLLGYVRGIYTSKSNKARYKSKELEFIQEPRHDTTDWNQVRIQAAIAAMQAFCNDKTLSYERTVTIAVRQADALVAELKKKGGSNEE